jgi:hypothetical protein
MSRNTVVLPPPEAPINAVTLPRGMRSDTSSRMTRSPYPKVRLRNFDKGIVWDGLHECKSRTEPGFLHDTGFR